MNVRFSAPTKAAAAVAAEKLATVLGDAPRTPVEICRRVNAAARRGAQRIRNAGTISDVGRNGPFSLSEAEHCRERSRVLLILVAKSQKVTQSPNFFQLMWPSVLRNPKHFHSTTLDNFNSHLKATTTPPLPIP